MDVYLLQDLISINSPRRHKLAVHVISVAEGGAGLSDVPGNNNSSQKGEEVIPV